MTTTRTTPVWQTMVYDGLFAVTVFPPEDAQSNKGVLSVWHAGSGDLLYSEPVAVHARETGPTEMDKWLWRGVAMRFLSSHLNGGDGIV